MNIDVYRWFVDNLRPSGIGETTKISINFVWIRQKKIKFTMFFPFSWLMCCFWERECYTGIL